MQIIFYMTKNVLHYFVVHERKKSQLVIERKYPTGELLEKRERVAKIVHMETPKG